jgi:hypothetical protein
MGADVSDLRDAAIAYAEHGLRVFPLAPRTKEPLQESRGFKDATTDVARVAAWWRETPNANIGIHPAPDLLILDADGARGIEAARSRGLLDPQTLVCLTGRSDGGMHLYFRHPGFRVSNRDLAPDLNVRCDNGYGILPPSIHPSGAVYRWRGRLSDVRELSSAVRDELERVQERDEPASVVPIRPMNGTGDIHARVRGYLRRVGPRPIGQRDNTAYRVAAWLVNDMALDDATAWAYLAEWNQGNRPPLTQRELRAKLRSATRNGTHARGSGLVRDYRALPSYGGFGGPQR